MTGLVQRLPKASPSYRRMAALALHALTIHSRQPPTIAEWLINKLLGQLVKSKWPLIGATLSEPYISRTALRKCVYTYVLAATYPGNLN